jgi:hypothetical protein
MYWIRERYQIRTKKQQGLPKPWSEDKVFQTTYFCNVHREDDRVTKWIREYYSPHVDDPMFEYNIILSRFLNWPETLGFVGYRYAHTPDSLLSLLEHIAGNGQKVWGNAYVITTHGIPMPKATYLCRNVLEDVYKQLEHLKNVCRQGYLGVASRALQRVEGIGSFLAGQVLADLKNTVGYPNFHDFYTFVEPGPGSLRGASWFVYGEPDRVTTRSFMDHFRDIRYYTESHWPAGVPPVHSQDLQNCLCEFDKYCRVSTGSGRSKRGYNGTA